MDNETLISRLTAIQQAVTNIKGCPDKKRRDQAIDQVVAYVEETKKRVKEDA